MIYVDLMVLVTIYITCGLMLIFLLWLYYDRRDRNQYEKMRSPTVFVCVKCEQIYSKDKGEKKSACPSCGQVNIPLRF